MRRGFTLIEAIVAVVILVLLAAWLMPSLVRLASGPVRLSEQLQARSVLESLSDAEVLASLSGAGIPHTELGLVVRGTELVQGAMGAGTLGMAKPLPRRWLVLRALADSPAGRELASRIVALPVDEPQVASP